MKNIYMTSKAKHWFPIAAGAVALAGIAAVAAWFLHDGRAW